MKILENQNRWETGKLKTTAHNSKCSPSLHTHTHKEIKFENRDWRGLRRKGEKRKEMGGR